MTPIAIMYTRVSSLKHFPLAQTDLIYPIFEEEENINPYHIVVLSGEMGVGKSNIL